MDTTIPIYITKVSANVTDDAGHESVLEYDAGVYSSLNNAKNGPMEVMNKIINDHPAWKYHDLHLYVFESSLDSTQRKKLVFQDTDYILYCRY